MPQLRALMNPRVECNRAVVVSVAQFDPGVSLGRRPGADKDSKRLHKTLSKLGFKVDIHTDLSSDEIYELFLTGTTPGLRLEHISSPCTFMCRLTDSQSAYNQSDYRLHYLKYLIQESSLRNYLKKVIELK